MYSLSPLEAQVALNRIRSTRSTTSRWRRPDGMLSAGVGWLLLAGAAVAWNYAARRLRRTERLSYFCRRHRVLTGVALALGVWDWYLWHRHEEDNRRAA